MAPKKVRAKANARRTSDSLTDFTAVADLPGASRNPARIWARHEAGLTDTFDYSAKFRPAVFAAPTPIVVSSTWLTEPPLPSRPT